MFHRLKSDELWVHIDGGPLQIVELAPDGGRIDTLLGSEVGQQRDYCVSAGAWFGARPMKQAGYTLSTCLVAPGFEFDDFEIASRSQLLADFPGEVEIIGELTRESGS